MNAVKDKLIALVGEELKAANAIHPPFHSLHEGYAVLLEEEEETEEALKSVKEYLELVWHYSRMNKPEASRQMAENLEAKAIHLAAEAVQVAAMARKFQSIGKGENMTEDAASDAIAMIQQHEANDSQVKKALQDNGFRTLDEFLQAFSQVKRERDALFYEAQNRCGSCENASVNVTDELCLSCINGCGQKNNWKWRGLCKENGGTDG